MPSTPLAATDSLVQKDVADEGLLSHNSVTSLGGTKGSSPLSSKVATILSTSYSDAEFREALSLLDERGVKNDPRTRRQMRLDFQREVIDSNGEIIDGFGLVAEQLRRIKITLGKLSVGYEGMKAHMLAAHAETLPALLESSSLLEQRRQVETKQEVLSAFRDHFIMSEDELIALTATTEPVDDHFFVSLLRAKSISQDCQVLLGFEEQTLGLELMEQTSKNINLGYQKLYKWVQREFKTLNLENPQMNSNIRRALRALAERPSLFQNCLDFFAQARERILSDSFHVALTGAASLGIDHPSVKPIDLAAHDPLRYVGDMLAWLHSATVSEREALEVLFVAEGEELARGLKSGRDAEVWRLVADDDDADERGDFNAVRALHELVDRDISGASRMLRQRVEQVIQSNEEIIPAYKLATLINFYLVTFLKLLGTDSNLVESVGSLETEALRQFRALIRDHIATLQGEFQQTTLSLSPPGFLQDCLKQLEVIIGTYESSLSASIDQEAEFGSVLAEAFEPFMSGCENMAKSIEQPNDVVFLINCRLAAAKTLEPFHFTRRRGRQLRELVENEANALVASQKSFFVESSGLSALMQNVFAGKPTENFVVSRETLSRASQDLDDFLPSALMDATERLKHLQDSALARSITEKAAEQFCEDFEQLEQAIISAHDGEGDRENTESGHPRSVFPRTSAEIRVLLS